jgi:hypothetical protein
MRYFLDSLFDALLVLVLFIATMMLTIPTSAQQSDKSAPSVVKPTPAATNQPQQLQESLESLLRANSHPFRIDNGKLAGEGANLLASAMHNVQFVAMGEWHNRRAMHHFATALFRHLHERQGFNYFALEEDPYLSKLSSRAARDGGRPAMLKLGQRYPNAFHLYTESQLDMLADIGSMSKGATDPIWGLNQVFGAAHIYERLVKIAPDANARGVAQKMLDQALEYEKERFQKNTQYIANIAKQEDFDQLRAAFRPKAGSEAEWLIEQTALSNRIFSPFVTKPRPPSPVFYKSWVTRETNMKHLFADRYREAQAKGDKLPKVLAFFGGFHLYRGLSESTDIYTLGNFLSELAIFNKMQSFQIFAIVDDPDVRKGWQGPIAQVASEVAANSKVEGKAAEAVIIDLRPLIPFARRSKELDPNIRRLILGYDVFVVMRDSELGSLEKLKTPKFRWYPEGN